MEASDRRDPIQKWREALECISNKMGLSLGVNSSEADFVKVIVKAVKRVNEVIGLEEEDNYGGKNKGEISRIAIVQMKSSPISKRKFEPSGGGLVVSTLGGVVLLVHMPNTDFSQVQNC